MSNEVVSYIINKILECCVYLIPIFYRYILKAFYRIMIITNMGNISNKKYLRPVVISLLLVTSVSVCSFIMSQQSFAEDYKLDISIENNANVDTEADVSIKTEDDKVDTTININDDTEKLKETISGEPGDKIKVCLEESDDNSKYCQTKELPKDEDSNVKFKLEYKD